MSSIERYIDKLESAEPADNAPGDSTSRIGISEQQMEAGTGAASSITVQEADIDFEHLQETGMLTPLDSKGQFADEYRAIKRPLLKNAFGQGVVDIPHGNLIMLTSALPGEGKSFTAINLAMSMAMELDRTVLLVEADVAKPSICKYLGIPEPEQGLVDYLAEPDLELSDLLLKTNVPKLMLLPAGKQHHSSAELLGSQNMRDLMDQLSSRYSDRVVIFDSPPLLLTTEAVILSGLMGQIVLVVEAGKTQQSVVKAALELLDPKQTVGVVLNKNTAVAGSGYGYYGGYGHGYGYGTEQG